MGLAMHAKYVGVAVAAATVFGIAGFASMDDGESLSASQDEQGMLLTENEIRSFKAELSAAAARDSRINEKLAQLERQIDSLLTAVEATSDPDSAYGARDEKSLESELGDSPSLDTQFEAVEEDPVERDRKIALHLRERVEQLDTALALEEFDGTEAGVVQKKLLGSISQHHSDAAIVDIQCRGTLCRGNLAYPDRAAVETFMAEFATSFNWASDAEVHSFQEPTGGWSVAIYLATGENSLPQAVPEHP